MSVRLTPARRKWLEMLRDAGSAGEMPYGPECNTNMHARRAGLTRPLAGRGGVYVITEAGLAALEQDTPK
jgi:hypothetical protein